MVVKFSPRPARTVKISMIPYTKQIVEDFPEPITSTAPTPAGDHLFTVRSDMREYYYQKSKQGHFTVQRPSFSFLASALIVSFLTKRVRSPDEDDWKKLQRGLMYLKGTMHMKLCINVDNLSTIKWYVDASYGVHYDCKGHTGV